MTLAFSSSVKILPWVGDDYENPVTNTLGDKILVLGNSSYLPKGQPVPGPEVLRNWVVDDTRNQREEIGETLSYWKGIESALTGKTLVGKSRKDFWNSVCLYNYVQELGDAWDFIPTDEALARSRIAFLEVVLRLQPRKLLVLGLTTWNRLEKKENLFGKLTKHLGDDNDRRAIFPLGVATLPQRCLAMCLIHPSAPRFSSEKEHLYVQQFLKM